MTRDDTCAAPLAMRSAPATASMPNRAVSTIRTLDARIAKFPSSRFPEINPRVAGDQVSLIAAHPTKASAIRA